MDISETIQPRSDQQNYDDYIAGPKTVTVSEVRKGNAEQPVEIHLVEFPGRPFKPSKTVRRVLVSAWGPDASQYAGRRMTLFGDPTVKWAGSQVGGIRVSHLSHIEKPLTLALTETRGKRAKTTINPLPDAPAPVDWAAQIEGTAGDVEALRRLWQDASKAGANEDTLNRIAQAAQEATS
jgi:hypothetical protein